MAMYLADLCTIPTNLAGNAAMSLPCGLAPEDGLPVGLQIIAPAMKDDRLYRVGAAVEAALRGQVGAPAAGGGTVAVSSMIKKAKGFKKSKSGTYLSIGTHRCSARSASSSRPRRPARENDTLQLIDAAVSRRRHRHRRRPARTAS